MIAGLLVNLSSPYEQSLGASGAVYALMGALVVLRPGMTFYFEFIPLPMFVAGLLWLAQDIFGIFYPSNVANVAHILGLLVGAAVGVYWRKEFGDELPKWFRSNRDPVLEKELDAWEDVYMKK